MSDETVVESDGVRVTKSFDSEGFPVPAVRFDVVSTREEETTLTITDKIPEQFNIDQIGFHPEYGSEHWTATGDGVVRFERPIEAHEEFTTVYGVRMGDDEEPTAFLDAPTVIVGEDPVGPDIDDVVPPGSSDIVREFAGGRRDTLPGLDDGLLEEADLADANEPLLDALHENEGEIVDADAVEPAVTEAQDADEADVGLDEALLEAESYDDADASESSEPVGVEESLDEEPDFASDLDDALTADETLDDEPDDSWDEPVEAAAEETAAVLDSAPEPEPESTADPDPVASDASALDATDLAAALAEQLRAGDVANEDLLVLRDELAPKRSSVQLEHLQSRVSEMEAYADALGAFIDENGDAKGLLDDLQQDVEDVRTTIGDVETTLDDASDERAALWDSLEAVESNLETIDDVEARLDRVAGDLEALDERVSGVEEDASAISDIQADVRAIRDDVEALQAWRNQISDVFGG